MPGTLGLTGLTGFEVKTLRLVIYFHFQPVQTSKSSTMNHAFPLSFFSSTSSNLKELNHEPPPLSFFSFTQGHVYFTCEPGHGVLVVPAKVSLL